jgi:hypothetical protein
LIGQQQQRQGAGRIFFPECQLSARCLPMSRLKTFPDGGIESGVPREPARQSGLAPKGDDILRFSGA